MQPHARTRRGALFLPFILAIALVACNGDDEQAEEDPRGALRDAVAQVGDYDGVELVFGAQLDEEARSSAREDGELTEEELELLTGSTLTVRGVAGDGDEDGESEFEVVVGDETVLTVRALPDTELYALIDLPAIERVAEDLDAEGDFQQGLAEFEQLAGLFGLGEVATAAREAEWIRVTGLDQMLEMAEEEADGDELDEADVERLARDVGQRLEAFLDDEDVDVQHVGDDDAGERIRMTARGAQLRELVADLFEAFDDATDIGDPTGMGMDPAELRDELDASIPDDVEISIDAWVDGGELSQVAVDVFAVARAAEEEDVPDGEFLVAVGISEFTDGIEAPETDVTFDVVELFGDLLGGLGGLGDDPFADEDVEELPDEGPPELDEDACLSREEVDQLLEQLPEEQQDIDDDEVEALLGLPVC